MFTEYILLLALFAFIVLGAFFGDSGPKATFAKSGPRLAARIEQNISTGRGFKIKGGTTLEWQKPAGAPQTETL